MYDYSVQPTDFFGVACIGITMDKWNALPGADVEYDDIFTSQMS
jgi:hypothetical protein